MSGVMGVTAAGAVVVVVVEDDVCDSAGSAAAEKNTAAPIVWERRDRNFMSQGSADKDMPAKKNTGTARTVPVTVLPGLRVLH
jgi:hypothetical protein